MENFNIEQLPIDISYVGLTTSDDKWACDQWRVTLNFTYRGKNETYTTDYFTGLGHRTPIRKPAFGTMPTRGTMAYKALEDARKPVKPKKADILYSLFMDTSLTDCSFNDWCDELGYSADSFKAFNMYQECCEIGEMLRKAFDAETTVAIHSIIDEM
jgi:hypothetical protein